MKRNKTVKRIVSLFLIFCLTFTYVPLAVSGNAASYAAGEGYEKTVDAPTWDSWKNIFGPDIMNTQNAGGVWVDKSVFADASAFPANTVSLNGKNNFLVALSALAANKEIVGYSTIPTDTMLVLDVSASMSSESVRALVLSANSAIKKLYDTNQNNRVGVVLYSGTRYQGPSKYAEGTTLLLPLDRYTTGDNGVYLNYTNGFISVNSQVRSSSNNHVSASKEVTGGTYIQAGLWEALLQFEAADTVIEQDNFQSGQSRLPILVLMSDGAPTLATHHYDEVNKKYTVGTGRPGGGQQTTSDENTAGRGGGTSDELAFLTQLTASYVLSRMEEHYGCSGEGLFYTLGLALSGSPEALSVLDPELSTSDINRYWGSFFRLGNTSSLSLTVPNPQTGGRNTTVSVTRNPAVTTQYYVDEYFAANTSDELIDAFDDIVNEILIQSRYYATDLEGGNPDFSGYLTFEDKIGEYMEVKDVKGILLGDVLFDGHMLASKLNNSASDGLGSISDPSVLGHQFISSVQQRLGITELTDAMALVQNAYTYGQLAYNVDGEKVTWSNYIGWYANADGSYAGFWHEGVTTAPENAVYKIKSYGFLGEASGNINDSDMMFMTVQVRESVLTGEQTVVWKIPAALVPMVTYKVTLDGNSVENATNVTLQREDAQPIRLVFETGLRSYLNELNITSVKDPKHVADDGSRIFWTNYWDNSAEEHINHETTTVGFTPSEENERYYYTTDAIVYKKVGEDYVPVQSSETLSETTYYHARYVFSADKTTAYNYYEPISAQSLAKAKESESGGQRVWVIPQGTIYRYLEDGMLPKSENTTNSIIFSHFPYITHTNASYEMDAKLGNNGMLRVYPATGIALTKTIDVTEPGTSTTFKFRITLKDASGVAISGSFDALLSDAGQTSGETFSVTFADGVLDVELDAEKTLYITGLDAGTEYTVEEISDNTDYRVKTVHVNGEFIFGDTAYGRVAQYSLDDVDFLNTPTTEGNLYITKQVEHPYGSGYSVDDKGLEFEITATLVYDGEPLSNKQYTIVTDTGEDTVTTDADGKFTVILVPGQTVAVHGIPEKAEYTIEEKEIAGDGFTLDLAKSAALTGSISSVANAHATLVNKYEATPVSPEDNEITVEITKDFTGRSWKQGDRFEFVIEELHPETNEPIDTVAMIVIDDANELTKLFDLTNEIYSAVGIYHYRIREIAGASDNGITYDAVYRRFHVTVTDVDMDGKLEIAGVEGVAKTTVTENGGNYKVAATFTNTYAPYVGDTVVIPIQKTMAADNFGLNGFKFALYDLEGDRPIVESHVTDSQGKTSIELAFSATDMGEHVYLLEEVYTGINGMTYSDKVYTVTVTVSDNGDGTVTADYVINDETGALVDETPTFENSYEPTEAQLVFSGTKTLDGRLLGRDEFSFELYETDADFSLDGVIAKHTVKNAFDGSFVFPTLVFAGEGTYYFVIKEVKGNLGGITYDEKQYKITVVVTDDNGTLRISHDLTEDIVFNNKYDPKDVTVSLEGNKILTGRDIEDGEFEFVLFDAQGNEIAKTKNEKDKFYFRAEDIDELVFDRAGDYVFTVKETAGDLGGVSYDSSVYTVTVTVTDDARGALHATVSYKKDALDATGIVFRNAYAPSPYDILIEGEKELVGRDMSANEFEFVLVGGLTSKEIEKVRNAGDGSFSFAALTVQRANTYHLRVSEINTDLGGIGYDTTVYDIYVTVNDDGNGSLYESGRKIMKNGVDFDGGIKFENTYSVTPIFNTLGGTKKLEGRDLEPEEFSFTLYDAKLDDASGKIVKDDNDPETVKNAGNGSFAFDEIEYTKAGTYYYIVEEAAGSLGGIKYDTTTYYVTVTVTDNLDGTLSAAIAYSDGTDSKTEIIFNNTYSTDDTSLTLGGTKKLEGRGLNEGEFEFVLYDAKLDASGNIVKDDNDPEKVKNASDGSFSFKKIEYTAAGTYYYIIEETEGTVAGVTYDKTVYYVTVTVVDNLDGTLSAAAVYTTENASADSVVFENKYAATVAASVSIEGTKKLEGRDLAAGEFSFKLYNAKLDDSGKLVRDGDAIKTAANAQNGMIDFGEFDFDSAGKSYFIIEEDTSANADGITYDTTVYYITVEVTDGGDGAFDADVKIESSKGGEVDEIVFTNVYEKIENPPTGDCELWMYCALALISGGLLLSLTLKKRKEQR